MEDQTLVELVRDRVREIPAGQVMSYGQVGDFVGCSAREAGWAMNQIADQNEAPWQRVVGSDGTLRIAKRSAAWALRQRNLLEAEGVALKPNGCVDMAKHQSGTLSKEVQKKEVQKKEVQKKEVQKKETQKKETQKKETQKKETQKTETLELGFE